MTTNGSTEQAELELKLSAARAMEKIVIEVELDDEQVQGLTVVVLRHLSIALNALTHMAGQ